MNIIEAIKSGLPFKRKNWKKWVEPHWATVLKLDSAYKSYANKDDLIADDWVILMTKKECCNCCCCHKNERDVVGV